MKEQVNLARLPGEDSAAYAERIARGTAQRAEKNAVIKGLNEVGQVNAGIVVPIEKRS